MALFMCDGCESYHDSHESGYNNDMIGDDYTKWIAYCDGCYINLPIVEEQED
jgi:hypothetical protein